MIKFKWMSIVVLAGGLMIGGCSSDNEIIDNNDSDTDSSKSEWTKLTISSEVENGNDVDLNTRSAEEVENGNPKAELPKGLKYYVNIYNGKDGKVRNKYLELEGETLALFYKPETGEDGKSYMVISNKDIKESGNLTENDTLKIEMRENANYVTGESVFFITTYNVAKEGSTIKLPQTPRESDIYYDESYIEYGDKLFATDGHFFVKNNDGTEGATLYYANKPDTYKVEGEITKMKRMTGVITIYTMVVEDFNGDIPQMIGGVEAGTTLEETIKATNKSLEVAFLRATRNPKEYFNNGEFDFSENSDWESFIKNMDINYNATDYFTRKKVLKNFPIEYDFVTGEADWTKRRIFYLCNLNAPAWMNEKSSYHWASSDPNSETIHGLSSSCDNYPFIPIVGKDLVIKDTTPLTLFMGMAKTTDTTAPKHLLQVTVTPTNELLLQANYSHNLYVVFTIKDLVRMAVLAQKEGAVGTRSASEELGFTLPSNRLIVQ